MIVDTSVLLAIVFREEGFSIRSRSSAATSR
jgi:uncharacterized protein with PIN domain